MSTARLELQQLRPQSSQVLVVATLAQAQSGRTEFTTSEVQKTFASLRIPAPANVSRVLRDLCVAEFLVRLPTKGFALTPSGEDRSLQFGGVVLTAADLVHPSPGAEFGVAGHQTLPPGLAPVALAVPIRRFLEKHAFEKSVFGISRFPADAADPLSACLDSVREETNAYGLEFHLASDKAVADELWANVAGSLWSCALGVAIIENRAGAGLNPNVLLEVGAMLVTGRRCVLLRDSTVAKMPTDLVGHIYRDVDLDDVSTVRRAVAAWCGDDLGLNRLAS